MHAMNLFGAFLMTLRSQIISVNARELLESLSLLVQLSPSPLWVSGIGKSGLFTHLLQTLIAGEVC